MSSLLKEFISFILSERSFDTAAYNFAKQLSDDIADTIGDAKLKPLKVKSGNYGNLIGFYTTVSGLGIMVPSLLKSLQVGIAMYENPNAPNDTRALYLPDASHGPGKILIMPGKISNRKDPNLQASQAFQDYKKYLFHELVHFFELYVMNDKSRMAQFNKSMKNNQNLGLDQMKQDDDYFMSHHERNAYLQQAFYDTMKELDIDSKTRAEAEALIPNGHVLWDELTEHTPTHWDTSFGTIKLRKLFAARAWELWQAQLEKLSDE